VRLANGHALPSDKRLAALAQTPRPALAMLGPDGSVACRERLLAEIDGAGSVDEITAWAREAMATKNTLRAEDSTVVEEAFAAKLGQLGAAEKSHEIVEPPPGLSPDPNPMLGATSPEMTGEKGSSAAADGKLIVSLTANTIPHEDCGALAFGKISRKRDKNHRAFVSSKPCIVCGRRPVDSHHLRFAQPRALGRKVSDEFTVP